MIAGSLQSFYRNNSNLWYRYPPVVFVGLTIGVFVGWWVSGALQRLSYLSDFNIGTSQSNLPLLGRSQQPPTTGKYTVLVSSQPQALLVL